MSGFCEISSKIGGVVYLALTSLSAVDMEARAKAALVDHMALCYRGQRSETGVARVPDSVELAFQLWTYM